MTGAGLASEFQIYTGSDMMGKTLKVRLIIGLYLRDVSESESVFSQQANIFTVCYLLISRLHTCTHTRQKPNYKVFH